MVKLFQISKGGGLSTSRKLILGFAGASAAAIVGTAGLAAAQADPPSGNGTPAAVAFCKANGQSLGFKNQGQCVAAFEHSIGHGYGSGGSNNTVTTSITNDISGNNNFVSTVINNIF